MSRRARGLGARRQRALGAARALALGARVRLPGPRPNAESGSAIIEFVFVALLVLVPLVYLIVVIASVQRIKLATTDAARSVGRAIETSASTADAQLRAEAALRLALGSENLSPAEVELRYVGAGADCSSAAVRPVLTPGSEFTVCVTRRQQLPAIPAVLSGGGVVAIGRFVVHVDDFRVLAP